MNCKLKADREAFVKAVNELLDKLGFVHYPEDEPHYDRCSRYRWAMSDRYGRYDVSFPDDEKDYRDGFHIYGRFKEKAKIARTYGELDDINPHSLKWNVCYDRDTRGHWVIEVFEERMETIGIRPPTPEEKEKIDADFNEETARLSIQRREFRASLGKDVLVTPVEDFPEGLQSAVKEPVVITGPRFRSQELPSK